MNDKVQNEWLPGFQQKCQNIASMYILNRLGPLNKKPFKLNLQPKYHLVFLVFYLQSTSVEKSMNDKVRLGGFYQKLQYLFWIYLLYIANYNFFTGVVTFRF